MYFFQRDLGEFRHTTNKNPWLVSKFVKHLQLEETYAPRQMIYLHLNMPEKPNKTKEDENNTHVSTLKIPIQYLPQKDE